MLLLYQLSEATEEYRSMNLHSIMLLLYHRQKRHKGDKEKIYIPLCFYFISFTRHPVICRQTYLHSIMLLLYRIQCGCRRSARSIYIPLCFYFIPFLFSPLISCSSDLYFVHLLFSLYFHFKNILVKSPKCNFTLAVRALSTYWKFYTISSRQLQKVARFIIIYTPELFRNPLFISAFKNN